MRVINLARRPFVNRRPVVRVAGLLWVVGALLLAWNVYLYRSHWVNSRHEREELARAERELDVQYRLLEEQREKLGGVNVQFANRRAAFLNSLISYRTFPWSTLFEDLEEVLPDDVRLYSVQPDIRLAPETGRRSGGLRPARNTTRRASGAPGGDGRSADSRDAEPLASDEVGLELSGDAKNRQALYELVDRMYADPKFRSPFLANESLDRNQGPQTVVFRLRVIYLTRRPLEPVQEPAADVEIADGEEAAESESGSTPSLAAPGSSGGEAPGPAAFAGESEGDAGTPEAPRRTMRRALPPRSAPSGTSFPATGTDSNRAVPDRFAPGQEPGPASQEDSPQSDLTRAGVVIPGIPSAVQPPASGDPDSPTPGVTTPAETTETTPARVEPEVAERGPAEQEVADRDPAGRGPADRDPTGRETNDDDRPADPPEDDESGFKDPDASATPSNGSRLLGPSLPPRLAPGFMAPVNSAIEGVAA